MADLKRMKDPSIAQCCHQFRERWAASRDSVESFLESLDLAQVTDNEHLVASLIQCEIELQRQAQLIPDRESYRKRFPKIDEEVVDNLFRMPAPPPPDLLKKVNAAPVLPARYRVAERIGQGGIGSVWRVEDREMERPLAAKVLHPKFRLSPAANARLEREALLAGALQHPGIPPVFELGELVTGSKFFTMKLVEGKTLDQILSSRKQLSDSRSYLLGVFRQIAEAVGYAHVNGVIHRDLKPQNVMVGAFGEVQIMDWGMAKRIVDSPSKPTGPLSDDSNIAGSSDSDVVQAIETNSMSLDSSLVEQRDGLDANELTMHGDVVGTPMYMAPEQARGEHENLNERADVFALGSILFELLTGQRLYQSKDVLAAAAKGDVTEAIDRLQASESDKDLISICTRCLDPDSERRPADGQAVAMAVSSHLDSVASRLRETELEVVSAGVRLNEERKRRVQFYWLTGLIVSAVVMGMAGVIWQWNRARINAIAALDSAAESQRLAEKSRVSAEESERSANRSYGVLEIVTDAFGSVDPSLDGSDATMTAKEVLLNALASLKDSDLDDEGRMLLLDNLSKCFRELGDYHLAASTYQDSLELHKQLDGETHTDTLAVMEQLSIVHLDLGDREKAFELQENVLHIRQRELGIDDDDTLVAMNNLAMIHEKAGRNQKAAAMYEALLKLADAKEEEPEDKQIWMNNLAVAYANLGRMNDAVKLQESLLKVMKIKQGKDDPMTLIAMNNLSMAYKTLGRLDEAILLATETLELIQVKFGEDHPNTSIVMGNVALIHEYMGNFDEAVELNKQTLAIKKAKFGRDHRETLLTMNNLASTLRAVGRFEEALKLLQDALAIQKVSLGMKHPDLFSTMQNLAAVYSDMGNLENALQFEIETFELRSTELGEDHPSTLMSMSNLAGAYRSVGQYEKALNLFETSLEKKKDKLGERHPETLASMNGLANCYVDLGRVEESVAMHRLALEYYTELRGDKHPRRLLSMANLAIALARTDQVEEARELYQKALNGQQERLGKDHVETLRTMSNYSDLLFDSGETERAIAMLDEARIMCIATLGHDHRKTCGVTFDLVVQYQRQGELEKAESLFKPCLERMLSLRPSEWNTHEAQSFYGGLLLALGRKDDAVEWLTKGYEGLKRTEDSIRPVDRQKRMSAALKRLIELATQQEDGGAVENWRSELKALDGV